MLLHIGTFHLDVDSHGKTLWHRLSAPARILCSVLLVFAIALTPNGRWATWALYGIGLVFMILLTRVTLTVLLKRVAVEFMFIGAVLIGTLFRGGGSVLWQWGWLRLTTEGLTVLGSVSLKAFLSLLILNVLTMTTPIPALLQALSALRLPPLLVAILASMYRYIAVLSDEFHAMKRAALSRNLMGNRRWQRLVVGNMMGSLFIRTLDRGDRVHRAMLSRGYDGIPVVQVMPPRSRWDVIALTLTAVLVLAGQGIYLVSN